MIEYQLIRSQRRTLSISIDGEGALVVRAPMRMPVGQIEAFLIEKQRWIVQKQSLVQQRERFVLQQDACMPFCGAFLRVRLCGVPVGMDRDGFLLLPGERPLEAARAWRKQRAEQLLAPRIAHWAGQTGLIPASVRYTNAQKRWGSMSSRRDMRLNAALVHCPPECWDYVIVHELCHMAQPDHSPAFHALVRSFLPQADGIRTKLKTLGYSTAILE